MKRFLAVLLLLPAVPPGPAAAQTPAAPGPPGRVDDLDAYIEDPTVYAQNQEPAHAPRTVPYETVEAARAANQFGIELEARWDRSPYFKLLNGTWNFAFYERPAAVPADHSATNWDQIRVPRSWQTAGYDEIVYTNKKLTWTQIAEATDTTPPEVPDDYNPVGVYRRSFKAPQAWNRRRTFVHFEGVKQAFFVWVNGTYVGYDQGSATPAEFDVSEALDYGGENQVTVQVYRFSDGEALETQDAVRFSGIRRSVYLFSKPPAHVRDMAVRTALGGAYETGRLTVDATLANDGADGGAYTVTGRLFGPEGTPVATLSETATVAGGAEETVTLAAQVDDPALWSAEKPHLYELGLSLTPTGRRTPTEAMVESVGFVEYEVSGGQFRVNGEPVNIRGVNRPEHSFRHGRHVPFETTREDARLMKRHEIDAIRTAHYPNDPSLYALADEYGLYIQDEVNVETHWNKKLVQEQPAYHGQMVERFRRMVQRDRNRSSIFTWSTGNEAGFGPAHRQMAEYARSLPGSYVLYHQNSEGTAPYSPLAGARYPTIGRLYRMARTLDKPLVMGEYRHAFGNGMGGFDVFWDGIQPPYPNPPAHYDKLQGGFGWDWADQTVARPGDRPPFQRNGTTDGLVAADRTPYPELDAVKAGHEPFAVRGLNPEKGRIEIGNHYDFTNLAERTVRWTLSRAGSGETLQQGTLDLSLPPGQWTEATIPLEPPEHPEPGADHWLTVQVRLAEDRPYAEAGHVVGAERLPVSFGASPPPPTRAARMPPVSVDSSGGKGPVTITGEGFSYTFDRARGTFASLARGGTEVLAGGPRLTLWRPPTLPDDRPYAGAPAPRWRAAGLDDLTRTVQSVNVAETDAGPVRIVAESTVEGRDTTRAEVTYEYLVLGSGDVVTTVEMKPTPALEAAVTTLPRIGVKMDVPRAMDHVRWYGRGPGGSFPDRTGGQLPGVYEGGVADQFEPVVPPQANGLKTDTRWAALTRGGSAATAGLALLAVDSTLTFGTNRFANLAEADHRAELRPAEVLTVTLDHRMKGVGTKFHPPPERGLVPPEPARFRVVLRPYDTVEHDPEKLWQRQLMLPNAFR